MKRSEMFEKLATDIFVRLASRTAQLPPFSSNKEVDVAEEWALAATKQAIISASVFMREYEDVADVVKLADDLRCAERM